MAEWYGAILSLTGIAGLALYSAVVYVGDRFDWLDKDAQVGALGCAWVLACFGVIVMGALVQFVRPT